jgi:hypothetical protein
MGQQRQKDDRQNAAAIQAPKTILFLAHSLTAGYALEPQKLPS